MIRKNYQAWQANVLDYPENGSIKEKIKFFLGFAILAPSTFNAQPWKCKIVNNVLEVFLDYSRVPIKSDKTGRFAYISMGAFIENFSVASEKFGFTPQIKIDHSTKRINSIEHIATIRLIDQQKKSENLLFDAIKKRVTNRSLNLNKNIPPRVISELSNFLNNGQELVILDEKFKNEIIAISLKGDHNIWTNIEFRREHVDWVRHNLTSQFDGMPGFGVGVGLIPSLLARPVILSPFFAKFQSMKNKKALKSGKNFAVLCSNEKKEDFIKLGFLFEKIILYLTTHQIVVAPMGQFIEDDEARSQLIQITSNFSKLKPQLFFRFGYPSSSTKHSPRKPVDKILI